MDGAVGLADGHGDRPGFRPAYLLRGEVDVDRPVAGPGSTRPRTASTSSCSTARGSATYELTPGFTEYALAHPGADLRRHRPARRRAQHARGRARRRVVPRPGRHHCAPPTSAATGPRSSPSCTSSTRTAPRRSSAPTRLAVRRRRTSWPPTSSRGSARTGGSSTAGDWAAGGGRRRRLDAPGRLAGAAGARGRGAPAGRRHRARAPACTSSTSARTSTAGSG